MGFPHSVLIDFCLSGVGSSVHSECFKYLVWAKNTIDFALNNLQQ